MKRIAHSVRLNVWALAAAAPLAAALLYCGGQVPLTAPSGAEIFISANPTAIPVSGGVSTITVTGFKGENDGGGPLPNGTQIYFTTNVGQIEERVEMVDGIAKGYLRSNGRAGNATVVARSGSGIEAELANPVLIGNAEGINIVVTANPATVEGPDFTSTIVATVFDNDNNRLPGVPLIFSTSAGSLASQGSVLITNELGQATDRLTLMNESSATVTVFSGSVSGTVTIGRGTVVDPIVSSIFPASGVRGETLNVTINGLNFQPGASVSFGNGIVINSTAFISSNQLQVSITIDPGARIETAGRTVTVTNPDGGTGSLPDAFLITEPGVSQPFITSISPVSSGLRDPATVPITITGRDFQTGAVVGFTPGGIIVDSTVVNSDTQITVVIRIDVTVIGPQDFDITVINPDGGQDTLPSAFTAT
jgi:hypothetical protein